MNGSKCPHTFEYVCGTKKDAKKDVKHVKKKGHICTVYVKKYSPSLLCGVDIL